MVIDVGDERARVERLRARRNGEREAALAKAEGLRPDAEAAAAGFLEATRAWLAAHERLRSVGADVWQIGKDSGWWGDVEVPEPVMELATDVRRVVLGAVREDPGVFVPLPRRVRQVGPQMVRVVDRDGSVRHVSETDVSFHEDGTAFVDAQKQARPRGQAVDPDPPAGVDGVVRPEDARMAGRYRPVDDRGRFLDA